MVQNNTTTSKNINKSILILGNGFIGKNLYTYFTNKYNTIITSKKDIDIENTESIKKYLQNKNFDYIIYAIGLKDINKCEEHPNIAYSINSYGVKNVIDNLNGLSKFIYISTDYVFDGESGNYSEQSICNPMTTYGKSKFLGEKYSLKYSNSIIVRTAGVYGKGCLWLKDLIQNLSNNQQILCFSDIYNTPTYAINLAEMIDDMINIDFTGIINLNGDTKNNRYGLYFSVATVFEKNSNLLLSGISDRNFPKDISLNNNLYKYLIKKIPNSTMNGLIRFKNEH